MIIKNICMKAQSVSKSSCTSAYLYVLAVTIYQLNRMNDIGNESVLTA